MLTIEGNSSSKLCDGRSRRDFLRIGGLGMGGLGLPQLLQAEKSSGVGKSNKAIIMIYMAGAPSHQETFDMKMDAPSGIRSEFRPIKTNVPGIEICELMPNLAKSMDKCVPIRSLYGAPNGSHDSFMCYTGKVGSSLNQNGQPAGGWPSIGAVTSKMMGSMDPAIPAFVGLAPKAGHPPYGNSGQPGFLGFGHGPFKPSGPTEKEMKLENMTIGRLNERHGLLNSFDQFRREADQSGMMEGLDEFHDQAFGMLTSSKLAEAFDLEKEDPKVRERYGKGDPNRVGDGAPRNLEHFLLARRLVEAGARCVTLNFGRWDFHSKHAEGMRSHAPLFDQGLAALINDLHERGMGDDVTVVAWGEFGRTPKINANGGRDHWPRVGTALLAGGGMNTGQVIGATDRQGGEPIDRPVHFGEVFATIYQNLGIDANTTTVPDLNGRPHYLVDQWRPMKELV
ncbi:MAG: DUF1501 domain-containing protein [Verrucomicrobiales bacterium]|nr:DUF1501 domain-containing protein [Verrucomicrobiales bacterium]